MRTHLRIAVALFLIAGALFLATFVFASHIFNALSASVDTSGDEAALLSVAALTYTGELLTMAAAILGPLCVVTAWGVLTHRSWARLLGSGLAAVLVLIVPVGTLVGGYVLWVLLSRRSEPWFDAELRTDATPAPQ